MQRKDEKSLNRPDNDLMNDLLGVANQNFFLFEKQPMKSFKIRKILGKSIFEWIIDKIRGKACREKREYNDIISYRIFCSPRN